MLRIYPAELSCVGGVYTAIGCRDPVYSVHSRRRCVLAFRENPKKNLGRLMANFCVTYEILKKACILGDLETNIEYASFRYFDFSFFIST